MGSPYEQSMTTETVRTELKFTYLLLARLLRTTKTRLKNSTQLALPWRIHASLLQHGSCIIYYWLFRAVTIFVR